MFTQRPFPQQKCFINRRLCGLVGAAFLGYQVYGRRVRQQVLGVMGRVVPGVAFIVGIAAFAGAAYAGTFLDDLQSSKGVTITLGAEGRMTPRYEGSAKYEFIPAPLFDLRPLGTPPRFHAPRDGFGPTVYQLGPFEFGPVGH